MKKIFAIALAMVMVLSMASAFALSDCAVWGNDWPCSVADKTPFCGKGTVEIVPLVKVNTACGWEYQPNTCAGAVRSDFIHYAVKLTVEAYPDADWWTEANLFIDDSAITNVDNDLAGLDFADWDQLANSTVAGKINMKAKKEVVYYASFKDNVWTGWVNLDSTDKDYIAAADDLGNDDGVLNLKDVAYTVEVKDYALTCGQSYDAYKVCATLSSYYDGASTEAYNELGGYYYDFKEYNTPVAFEDLSTSGLAEDVLTVWDVDADGKIVNEVDFYIVKGAIVSSDWSGATAEFYKKVMADFGFDACGTAACVTEKNIQANFGWNDKQEDCASWSDKAASVVDAECVVSIPKTGDVSVVAYAVMAVAAAAGMLKK